MCCEQRWLSRVFHALLLEGVICLFGVPGLIDVRATLADGPADNNPETVRRIPALGIEVPAETRAQLEKGLSELSKAIAAAEQAQPKLKDLLPDVQIFHKAVNDALEFREFFTDKELPIAFELLQQGLTRAQQLAKGEAPWTTQTGLVVRGYVSKLDGSVQPYGLVIPNSYVANGNHRHRLDLWFHGRGEVLSELNFLASRQKDRGIFTPADGIVLHPYGRYCNAFKFAGEIDVLEAMAAVEKHYRIDPDRISSRGFSMGGAACWQFAVHYADRFVGATPGAGFSETPDFLKVFQKETLDPRPWEKTLWHWYDCNDWAINLWHCPTIAYSGENDSQKQAADIMEKALADVGIDLVHLIGPKTGHSYHPAVREEIERRFDTIVARGRDKNPRNVHLTTYTLRYNRMFWLQLDGLKEHWEKALVDGSWDADGSIDLSTTNVTGLTISFAPGEAPFDITRPVSIRIDGHDVKGPRPRSDRSFHCSLKLEAGGWVVGTHSADTIRKRPGLQGPIDDALMDSFIFVKPTGIGRNQQVDQWARREMDRAIVHWRQQFRGRARVVNDTDVTPEMIASMNLVVWGDPQSNKLLAQVADKLPISWGDTEIVVGAEKFPADTHGLIACVPNPLNPQRYLVINSSCTYREYDYLNNARQVAKLPDWAIIDTRTPAGPRYPGKVVTADFFDETWKVKRK